MVLSRNDFGIFSAAVWHNIDLEHFAQAHHRKIPSVCLSQIVPPSSLLSNYDDSERKNC
jgi:hypothetical protein